MTQRYKFSVESKSFPLDLSGEPLLPFPDSRASWQNRKAAADSAGNKTMTSPDGLIKFYGMATANIFCE
jgi:hypothetical protein